MNVRRTLILTCLLLCACTAVVPEPEIQETGTPEVELMSFTAIPEEQVRNSLDGSNGVRWSQTDAISMFSVNGGKGVRFSVSGLEDDGAVATFSGPSGDYALALCPASDDAVYTPSAGTLATSIPTVQTGVEDSFADGANLSVAQVGASANLYFRNAGALLSFIVPGNWITRVRIRSLNESVAMSGQTRITFANGIPVVSSTSKSFNYVEVNVPEQSAGKRYYAAVLPGNYSDGFAVTFLTSSGAYNRYTSTKALDLGRNSIVSLIRKNWTVTDDRGQNSLSGTELIAPVISSGSAIGNGAAKIVFSCGSGVRDTYKFYYRDAGSMGAGTLAGTLNTGSGQYGSYNYTFTGLTGGTRYDLGVCASASGYTDSQTVWLQDVLITGNSQPQQDGMYDWERGRSGVPSFADISIVTLGRHNPNPPAWTKDRFASHVIYTDGGGQSHWLYDAFLCCDTYDSARNRVYNVAPSGKSAIKESWEDLLEAWLGDNGALRKLDAAIGDAAAVLGTPPRPRYVVMALPDPIMFETFSNKNSSTTYWGQLDGVTLDFSKVADQKAAYKWYADRCRERFDALGFNYLELAGFYILSEELHLPASYYTSLGMSYGYNDTTNSQYKRWEQLIPYVADYAHSVREGLWWIPYFCAPGYAVWNHLGFDRAFMQPNHYWDHGSTQHSMSTTINRLKQYNMGIELEFEYTMVASVMADGRSGPDMNGNAVFYAADVPALRSNFRDYLTAYAGSGLYGVLPIAVYSGTDAMHQLAVSADAGDVEMYHELCQLIINSPLKQ